jgi:hypothetical protein
MNAVPVVIVSAFGRGQSLAARLAELEIPVALIDVSEQLGTSAPEDEEGPFGLFLSGLSKVAQERLHQDDPIQNQEEGWTIVLPDGPLELKSPLTKTRLEKLRIPLEILETFRDVREGKLNNLSPWMNADLQKSWLVELAAGFASNSLRLYPEAMASGALLPLDGEFWIRPVTRPGLLQSLQWCERKGVQVRRDYVIIDLAREGRRHLKGLQFRLKASQTTEILNFEKLVWCLSSEETAFLSEGLAEKLFPEGALKPSWIWTRFRLRMGPSPERDILPFHSVWIDSLELPWTHENLIVLQKSPSPDLLDAWIRIPAEQRLQKSYLLDRLGRVLENLAKRFVTVRPVKAEEPLSSEKTYREVGPSRQPLFDPKTLLSWRGPVDDNIWLHAPEVWSGLGWNSILKFEDKIFSQVEAWWKKREEQRIKREQKGRRP